MICRACNRNAHDACPGEIHSGMPCSCTEYVCGGNVVELVFRREQAEALRDKAHALVREASAMILEAEAMKHSDYEQRKME